MHFLNISPYIFLMGVFSMKKNGLLKNAFILTITSFILRGFGIVLRSYMSNKIGAEGMGLYQLIVSIYVLATTFVTARNCNCSNKNCYSCNCKWKK